MNEIGTFRRLLWGVAGGLLAVISKYLAQDHDRYILFMETAQTAKLWGMGASYLILLVGLCVMGGIIAAATPESSRLKLLAIAVSAPAMVTTWTGGGGAKQVATYLSPVSVAYAQETKQATSSEFWEGFAGTF
jgi:hypothetical protein